MVGVGVRPSRGVTGDRGHASSGRVSAGSPSRVVGLGELPDDDLPPVRNGVLAAARLCGVHE